MQPESWGQLSISSRRALLWAGALARYRAEQEGQDPTSAQADPFDLLVGMLLEHPNDAEPKILLEHFRIAPGEVLPPTYERPSPEAIERHLREGPADGPPPTDPELSIILEEGTSLGLSSGSAEVAELRALFAAMLQSSNPLKRCHALPPLKRCHALLKRCPPSRGATHFSDEGAGRRGWKLDALREAAQTRR